MPDAPTPYAHLAAGHHQVAFVVRDIAAAERFFIEKMGLPGFFRIEDIPIYESLYRGRPGDCHMSLSLGYAGDTQFELVQPLSGSSIYTDFLNAKGEGLHHLGFIVEDEAKVTADFAANGFGVIQSGRLGTNPGMRFVYFDTEAAIGAVMEALFLDEETRRLFDRVKGGKFGAVPPSR